MRSISSKALTRASATVVLPEPEPPARPMSSGRSPGQPSNSSALLVHHLHRPLLLANDRDVIPGGDIGDGRPICSNLLPTDRLHFEPFAENANEDPRLRVAVPRQRPPAPA